MNKVKSIVGQLFESPMQNMSFVSYMAYVNTAGKITAKSLLDLITVCLTVIDDQEKKLDIYEENFKQIEGILSKLVDKKTPISPELTENPQKEALDVQKPLDLKEFEKPTPMIEKDGTLFVNNEKPPVEFDKPITPIANAAPPTETNLPPYKCLECEKSFSSKIALAGHSRSHKAKTT